MLTAIPLYLQSGSTHFSFNILHLILQFYLPYFKKASEMHSFGAQTRFASDSTVLIARRCLVRWADGKRLVTAVTWSDVCISVRRNSKLRVSCALAQCWSCRCSGLWCYVPLRYAALWFLHPDRFEGLPFYRHGGAVLCSNGDSGLSWFFLAL